MVWVDITLSAPLPPAPLFSIRACMWTAFPSLSEAVPGDLFSGTVSPEVWRTSGHLGGTSDKEPACQCRRWKRSGFSPWVRNIPWRRTWQPAPVFFLVWRIPWTDKAGELQSMGSQSQIRLKQLSMHFLLIWIINYLLRMHFNLEINARKYFY